MTRMRDLVEDWLAHLGVERGASVHTLAAYRRDVERFKVDLAQRGVVDLESVSTEHVEDHLRRLASGDLTGRPAAPSSVERALSAIRGLLRHAMREGLLAVDPTDGVTAPRRGLHLPKALTVGQVAAMLDAARRDDPVSLRDSALLEVLYATGARISEAVGLAADDLDLDAELPVLRLFGKGRKERIVPIGRWAQEALDAYLVRSRPVLAQRGEGTTALFLNQRGRVLSRQSAWEIVRRAAQRAGVDVEVSPHTLRHSFATHLLEGGASVRDVQELLGHSSVQTTQIYTRVTARTLREVHRSAHPRP